MRLPRSQPAEEPSLVVRCCAAAPDQAPSSGCSVQASTCAELVGVTRLFVPVQLRWSDLDAYGHVNNVEMFRLLEEARITAFWAHPQEDEVAAPADPAAFAAPAAWPTAVLDSGPGASSHTFVARQEIEYLRPLGFDRRPVRVEMWIGHMGGASLDVCYEVHDDGTPAERTGEGSAARPVARAVTTIVLVSAATGSPRRIAPHERAAWEPFLGEPISFRRRGA